MERRYQGWRSAGLTALLGGLVGGLWSGVAWSQPTPEGVTVGDPARLCASQVGRAVPAATFALPTGDATVTEAELIPADPAAAMPEYCRLRGAIAAVDAADPPILFQVNLPSRWNGKTVQYGGGGLNGVVIEATGAFAGGGLAPPALAQGYVSYGSDSGHQTPGRDFIDNAQAFANYSHEAVKRTRDLTGALVRRYYGREARRNYHIGGSKGGQEGLQAAQRYAADFDGVVSYYPAAQNQSLTLGWNRLWHLAFDPPGGALDTAEQALLKTAVMTACDARDGAEDGIVSDVGGCGRAFDVRRLRCPDGEDAGDGCLSDRQLAALQDATRPFRFAYPMPNGVDSVGPWPALIGGDVELWFGEGVEGTQQAFYRGPARPEALTSSGISQDDWAANVDAVARIYDASNPNLDAFKAKGGKLILVQGTTDMLVPHPMTTGYAQALQARYGADALRSFVRYYVAPGYGHGGGAFVVSWDALSALDAWVERDAAPVDPVVEDAGEAHRGRTRPLCEHPSWPRRRDDGDPQRAESFVCATR